MVTIFFRLSRRCTYGINPTYDELKEWHGKSELPLKKFFNTSGLLYKEIQLKDKIPTMSEEELVLEYNHRHEMLNKLYL